MKKEEIIAMKKAEKKVVIEDNGKTLTFRKKFSIGWAIFWFLFGGFGVIIYIAYHFCKLKEQINYK